MEFSSVYLFTSWEFLLFFAVALLVYFAVPAVLRRFPAAEGVRKNFQWSWLLIASAVFYVSYYVFLSGVYTFGKYAYLFILCLIASILSVYLFGRALAFFNRNQSEYLSAHKDITKDEKKAYKERIKKKKQLLIFLCCIFNIGILCVLKYTGFFASVVNSLGGNMRKPEWITLPLGISFYTFAAIGYVVDVYRGVSDAERNPLKLALFVSYFPQMFQGPIGRYNKLAPQLFEEHSFDYDRFASGVIRMAWGFFKKLVIADRLGKFVDAIYSSSADYRGLAIVAAFLLYTIQLYTDFSGYMDIALGGSECLGIRLTENFERPFFSLSVDEFWRRWHISLGDWFRDYLFYPILRSSWCMALVKKVGKKKNAFTKFVSKNIGTVIALAIVWLTMGFWHGDAWHFVLMGVFFGAVIILSTLLSGVFKVTNKRFSSPIVNVLRMVRTFLIITVGFVLFRADSISQAAQMFTQIFSRSGQGGLIVAGFNSFQWIISVLVIAVLLIVSILQEKLGRSICSVLTEKHKTMRFVVALVLIFAVLTLGIYGGGGGSFAYFDF